MKTFRVRLTYMVPHTAVVEVRACSIESACNTALVNDFEGAYRNDYLKYDEEPVFVEGVEDEAGNELEVPRIYRVG